MTVNIVQEQHIDLIKRIIVSNPYYRNNEDLLPSFCNEVYSKSYLLFKSVSNFDYLQSYLKKVVTNSMINVLKRNGRLRTNPNSAYMTRATNEFLSEDVSLDSIQKKNQSVYDIYKVADPFPENFEYTASAPDMQKMLQLVQIVHSENQDKQYIDIFYARYIHNKTLETIAKELNLSQNEVNQRLLDLADIIRENATL